MNQQFTYGHWISPIEIPEPNPYVGFIYQITNKATGKRYIGRKQMTSTTKKQVKCKTTTGTKTRRITKPSKWMTYTGSSAQLNADITKYGINQFEFRILSFHTSKSALNYAEVHALVTQNALTSYLPNGEPAFYNGLIPPVRTRPKL